jgi:hypothetical protein
VCFEHIGEKTYYLFGIANVLSIPIVWALYPESNQRTLEEIDFLFAAPVPWTWTAEENFRRLKAEHPEIAHDVSVARVRSLSISAEEGKAHPNVQELLKRAEL